MSRYYRCFACGQAHREGDEKRAPSPFDPEDIITACPHCNAIHGEPTLALLCEEPGCPRTAGSGRLTARGYLQLCSVHAAETQSEIVL